MFLPAEHLRRVRHGDQRKARCIDIAGIVRFLIVRANSSQHLSKFWRTTMQKKANGQAPADNSRLILQGY